MTTLETGQTKHSKRLLQKKNVFQYVLVNITFITSFFLLTSPPPSSPRRNIFLHIGLFQFIHTSASHTVARCCYKHISSVKYFPSNNFSQAVFFRSGLRFLSHVTKVMLNLSLPSHKAFRSFVQKGGSKMAVGFFEAFIKIWDHYFIEWEERGPNKTFLTDFFKELSIYGFISVNDILLCLCLGVLITILRYFLTVAVFKVGVLQDYLSLFWSQVLLRDGLPLVHVIKNLHWFSLYLCYERYSFCFSESKLHRFCTQTSEQRSSQRAGRSATRFDLFCFVVKRKPIVEIVYLNHENRTTPTLKSSIAIYCY